jgi:hypothetical protein
MYPGDPDADIAGGVDFGGSGHAVAADVGNTVCDEAVYENRSAKASMGRIDFCLTALIHENRIGYS